jgi:hypothetical protein
MVVHLGAAEEKFVLY